MEIFCDCCQREFRKRNPQGRILSAIDGQTYHFQRNTGYEYPKYTVCGRDNGQFENMSGTIGVDISEDDIDFHVQLGKRPCPRCWGQWWKPMLRARMFHVKRQIGRS